MSGKTYACTDLHGSLWAWNKIKEILQPDDTLYFLGDAIDRGEHGYTIMLDMLTDERVIYLCGNHEDMMYDYYKSYDSDWKRNGYEPTLREIKKYHDNETLNFALNMIPQLPICAEYINANGVCVFMSHSGYCDMLQPSDWRYDFLWNRAHFIKTDDVPDNTVVIHGHTPISFVKSKIENIYTENIQDVYWYANHKKCCMDMGTVWLDVFALMDLDTLEAQIFYKEQ